MRNILKSRSATAAFLARRAHLIALATFAIAAAAVLDDYGLSNDVERQRLVGSVALDYILGDSDRLLENHDYYYGIAVEVPLTLMERVLPLEDSRDIHLSRHLVTHATFLVGGFFAWLLAYRLFGSRLVALLAMLIFLLHPRMYAHSFFNTKDLPFLAAFMVSLYLVHRAFRRDSLWAFALCGAGVALATNIRIMSVMLIPAVLGMLALDALRAAPRGDGIKDAAIRASAFIAAFAAALYAAWPPLWRDPLALMDAVRVLAVHPTLINFIFRGEVLLWPEIPWDFIPTWILITTPPFILILTALGTARVARLCAVRRWDALANSDARFGLLALACLILPIAAAIALNSNMYHDWRHVYFLYAPICVLAAFGLRWLAALRNPRLRAGAFALAALGIAATVAQMVSLHPYQNEYFNILANKNTLAERWDMGYWRMANKDALKALLAMQPSGIIPVNVRVSIQALPKEDRARLAFSQFFPSFKILDIGSEELPKYGDSAVWERAVYGVPIISLFDVREETAAVLRAQYAATRAQPPDASAGGFDIRADGDSLVYAKENCGEQDKLGTFHTLIFPSHRRDLPGGAREAGRDYESLNFGFWRYGGAVDGKCLIRAPLPSYPIHAVETGKRADVSGVSQWRAAIPLAESLDDYAAALAALPPSPDANGGGFGLYAQGGKLTYLKRGCSDADARGRFFLSVFPADPADLPQSARAAGLEHEPLNFDFHRHGAMVNGDCVIVRDMPDYPISRAETGQWLPGESNLWSAEVRFPAYANRYRAALSALSGEPAARSGFDLWLNGGELIYVKRGCSEDDARGRFFLSVFPLDPADLPQSARDAGMLHEPLNFAFREYGAIADGDCVIIRDLPDYPISRIETGQWLPGEGELWSAGIDVDGG